MYPQGRMSHHFREMKEGDYMAVKGPKVHSLSNNDIFFNLHSSCFGCVISFVLFSIEISNDILVFIAKAMMQNVILLLGEFYCYI